MKKYRLVAMLLILLVVFQLLAPSLIPSAQADDDSVTRDTVLVLDVSGSMYGEPMDALIESAKSFCTSLLKAKGVNRVAVITYDSYVELLCDLTGDQARIEKAIDEITSGGSTNIYGALLKAGELLENSNADIKNIVLMSDGLPNDGNYSYSGRYSSADYYDYEYANAVYELATSYHSRYYIYTLGFFHSLYGTDLDFAVRFMRDLQNAGYYDVDDPDELIFEFGELAEEITSLHQGGDFRYASEDGKDYTAHYYYDDSYFFSDSRTYNSSLATMSLCLAMSAFASNEADYSNQSKNVEDLLGQLQFIDIELMDSYTQRPGTDTIAAVMAQKPMEDDNGQKYTLLAVAVRGGGYEQEWASNFTIGESGEHKGFQEASDQVLTFIRDYLDRHDTVSGAVKLWITGYSRAAATANLTAAQLDRNLWLGTRVTLEASDLYAYCFETPAGTTKSDAHDALYGNIWNIINPNDLVTKVAPTAMGFTRFGNNFVLPTWENKYKKVTEETEAMLRQYNALESTGKYMLDQFAVWKVNPADVFLNHRVIATESRKDKQSMSAFLDRYFSTMVQEFLSRSFYVKELEDGVRDVFKTANMDTETMKAVIEGVADRIMDNLPVFLFLTLTNHDQAVILLKSYLKESLKDQGISSDAVVQAALPALGILVLHAACHMNLAATMVHNFGILKYAHYPELCLAWVQSMDPNYTTDAGLSFTNGGYRIVHINCPVDVMVYDESGVLAAAIVGDEPQDVDGSMIVASLNEDGEKLLYLPPDEDFTVTMTATDNCTVTYLVSEFNYELGQVDRLVGFYDAPVSAGETLRAELPAYQEDDLTSNKDIATDTVYSLYAPSGEALKPDLERSINRADTLCCMITAVSEDEEAGIALGSGIRDIGGFAMVTAIPAEKYRFAGWFEDGELVSSEEDYRFRATEDRSLTARFSKQDVKSPILIPVISIALAALVAGVLIVAVAASDNRKKPGEEQGIPVRQKESFSEPAMKKAVESGVDSAASEKQAQEQLQPKGAITVLRGSIQSISVPIAEGEQITLGRDAKSAQIVFEKKHELVSRLHCTISFHPENNSYYVTDQSSNGTYVQIGGTKTRLIKGRETRVPRGTEVILASKECKVRLE